MKKVFFLCLFLLTTSTLGQEINPDQTQEVETEQDETESDLPPITVNISIANNTDAQANNKTMVLQEQKVIQEAAEKKKQEDKKQQALQHVRTATTILRYFLLK